MKLGDYEQKGELKFTESTKADKEIKKGLDKIVKSYNENLEKYRFGQAAEEIYHFFWHQFCDKYIESAKIRLKTDKSAEATLHYILKNCLVMLHPFVPFVTEAVWQNLYAGLLLGEKWPRG